jgi:hypothetical protein
LLAGLSFVGCGTGGTPGASPSNSPVSGATGYQKISGTYVLAVASVDLADPAVVADSASGPYHIWMTYAGSEIRRSDLPNLGTDPTVPRPALAATESFEQGRVAAPSVAHDASGWHMAYEAADGVIALADSEDGEAWTNKRVVTLGHAPSLLGTQVFFEQAGEIWALESGPKETTPTTAMTPVHVLTGSSPDAHIVTTLAGRPLWQLFFNCSSPASPSIAICYAASFDGRSFESNGIPVLSPGAPDELGPSQVSGEGLDVLFFAQAPTGLRSRIGVAIAQ